MQLLKNMLDSKPEGAPQNRSTTLEFCVKVPPTAAESVPCLIDFKEAFDSLMGHHVEVQYQCKSGCTIEQLYDKAVNAVQLIGSKGVVQNNS